jgi:hypothetical protein
MPSAIAVPLFVVDTLLLQAVVRPVVVDLIVGLDRCRVGHSAAGVRPDLADHAVPRFPSGVPSHVQPSLGQNNCPSGPVFSGSPSRGQACGALSAQSRWSSRLAAMMLVS